MDEYRAELAPRPFGLNNTGVICYFNAFLQTLAGCTAFTRGVLLNADFLRRTATGAAIIDYVAAYTAARGGALEAGEPAAGIELRSSAVLRALVGDLAARRPNVRFGGGQESASEALIHLLDMMEPPRPAGAPLAGGAAESPITSLFQHRFRCDIHCRRCRAVVSKTTDFAVNFNLFHLDHLRAPPADAAAFSKAVRLQAEAIDDYRCPACPCAACGGRPGEAAACAGCGAPVPAAKAYRVYNLTMVPEIIYAMFNLYVGYGGNRRARFFPERLEFPARDGGLLIFRLVGQVEHAGALSGGHYWARGLRAGGRSYLLNDTGVTPAPFAATPGTYIVVYHYAGREPPPAA
jgi:hypothetical protein